MQIALHSTDDSKSDEELVWRDTDWKTVPYREYPWTLSTMQVIAANLVTYCIGLCPTELAGMTPALPEALDLQSQPPKC